MEAHLYKSKSQITLLAKLFTRVIQSVLSEKDSWVLGLGSV